MWPFKKTRPEPASNTVQPSRELRPFSFVPPELIRQIGGLPSEAIFGFMEGEGYSAEQFRPNPAFVKFLHEVIRRHVPANPALREAARQQEKGSLTIVDARAREGPNGSVSEHDIIGIFEVKDGLIPPASYIPNDRYLVFSEDGPPALTPELLQAFFFELARLAKERATSSN